ncbi:MAG TPA: HAMP domain-containing sensor histidine kinase [Candidatus Elarobacter sp.]|jgi:signal transduction histidine kinase
MSLRSRLTLSYASVVAVVLIILAVILTRFAFSFLTQPTFAAVADSVAAVQGIVAAHAREDTPALRELIVRIGTRPGVVVRLPPPRSERRDGMPRGGSPPRNAAEQFSLTTMLGLRPRFVRLFDGNEIFIAPDLRAIQPAVRAYLWSLAISLVLALVLAWLFARWITAQAIAPLITVTGELRRFASGDFTQRPVTTTDRSELGELIAAYNGATEQVASAFAERVRVEEQMRRFVADAGHELRTPLTVISGFIDVLARGGHDDPEIRERAFSTLRTETLRMRRLLERLMVLARLERPERPSAETVDVADIVRDAVAQVTAARHRDVDVRIGAPNALVLGDAGELHEAVGNLVDNALKYGADTPVTVHVSAADGDVLIAVHDGGPGIPEREQPHVFERFFRGQHASGIDGTGLGLAIVERAAARAGGSVQVQSTPRTGTTFTITLPSHTPATTTERELRVG